MRFTRSRFLLNECSNYSNKKLSKNIIYLCVDVLIGVARVCDGGQSSFAIEC